MIELLMILSLSPLSTHTTLASKPFTTCQMPNKCAKPALQLAQFQPCVWPNTCAKPALQLAQFKPCVWPNTCSRNSESVL